MTDIPAIVRTRVAPSPTGDPHVGTAYVALMNYLFAKQYGGEFIVRIEDTDQARSTRESETAIFESLRWCGLTWAEGVDVGGPHGPYRQSERTQIYRDHVQVLLEQGHAFKCFCTSERLDKMRSIQKATGKPPAYDGACLRLSDGDRAELETNGTPYVVRMKIPSRHASYRCSDEGKALIASVAGKTVENSGYHLDFDKGECEFHDMKRGNIKIAFDTIDMQVLMKSDGYPTYHLANVVDDHLMGITHVLRGEEWISSAPKHALLYSYFGWDMPKLCHLP